MANIDPKMINDPNFGAKAVARKTSGTAPSR
jgi:hypothetical protein